ncbi:MAG TPA: sodium/solute symporter [Candidatus Brocadiia bacterium]|nr:sodium/solute symporter [Candidatus Brocadiia bacterium]
MRTILRALAFLVLIALPLYCDEAGAHSVNILKWGELPELPPAPGRDIQPGVAGPFVGIHNDILLVAGGANFPDGMPWEGGRKVWHDNIYVLRKVADGRREWISDAGFKLPRALAYGASVNLDGGVLCIGGCDAEKSYADVFLVRWDALKREISFSEFPSLPVPLSFMTGARLGSKIYVVGGKTESASTCSFFMLDLTRQGKAGFAWEELPPWPGPERILPVVAAQNNGASDCLYVFSGRNEQPGMETAILTDAYRFDPKAYESELKRSGKDAACKIAWKRLSDVCVGKSGSSARSVMGGSAVPSGVNHVIVIGGDEGRVFMQSARLAKKIADLEKKLESESEPEAKKTLADTVAQEKRANQKLLEYHPGFSRDVLAYHAVTDSWAVLGRMPSDCPVTTCAVVWDGAIVVPTGEIRPGVRSPKVWTGCGETSRRFGILNYTVVGIYLLSMVLIGVLLMGREKSTDDFFRAGRRVPWWAAGLSIFGTQLSAITFMAIPAKTFSTDWRMFLFNMTIIMIAPFIILWFLPFYRRLNVTTAYEYLEKRFNLAARLCGSLMFVIVQLGRIGIVLYLPSIALSVVSGMDVRLCVLAMGVFSIIYTALGGIEAVIWTDVIQVIVLLGGALLCFAMMIFHVDGGPGAFVRMALEADKFRMLDFSLSMNSPTFWVVMLGGFAVNFISYGSDQAVIQRYLTTPDEKAAAKGIRINAIMCVPSSILFFAIGTALFAFFKSHPETMNPTLTNADAIFPWFIVTQLPNGVAGLLIAAIFAAAMSTLDSSMNSIATALTTDFYRRLKIGFAHRNPWTAAPDRETAHLSGIRGFLARRQDAIPVKRIELEESAYLSFARWITVVVGVAGTGFALMMTRWNIKSLWDQLNTILGLFAGGLAGMFLLGIFSRRAHGWCAVIGLAASGLVQYLISRYTHVHILLYSFTGLAVCVIVGELAAFLIPSNGKSIEGLTYYTMPKETPTEVT